MTADFLQPLYVLGKSFRGILIRPTENTGWSRTRGIDVKRIRNLHVRYSQAHRHKLEERVSHVEHHRFNARRRQLFGETSQRRFEEPGRYFLHMTAQHIFSMQLPDPTVHFSHETDWLLFLAKRIEVPIDGT